MAKFNLGNYLQDNVFSKNEFKQFTSGISNISGRIISFGSTMMNNMLKMSTNLSSFMSTSYFPYIILGLGSIVVLWKLKVI